MVWLVSDSWPNSRRRSSCVWPSPSGFIISWISGIRLGLGIRSALVALPAALSAASLSPSAIWASARDCALRPDASLRAHEGPCRGAEHAVGSGKVDPFGLQPRRDPGLPGDAHRPAAAEPDGAFITAQSA